MRFVGEFQQVTSPVTAKGIEDTALYIYGNQQVVIAVPRLVADLVPEANVPPLGERVWHAH